LLREERLLLRASSRPCWERRALNSGAGGEGGFKYVIVDGKYVKLRGGRKGVLLIALGLTNHGVRIVLDVVLTGEVDVVS